MSRRESLQDIALGVGLLVMALVLHPCSAAEEQKGTKQSGAKPAEKASVPPKDVINWKEDAPQRELMPPGMRGPLTPGQGKPLISTPPTKGEPGKILVPHPARKATTEKATGEAAIEKALDQSTTVDFTDTPLGEALTFLANTHRIEIQLDNKALEEVGVPTDSPITRSLKNVKLRSALDLTLRDLGLVWTINSEVLLITSPDVLATLLTTKVYDVADLIVFRDEKDQLWDDYEPLVEMVMDHIDNQGWSRDGGPGSITGAAFGGAKALIVTNDYHVHKQIEQLLKELRELAAKEKGDKKPPFRPRPETMKHKKPASQKASHHGPGASDGSDPFAN